MTENFFTNELPRNLTDFLKEVNTLAVVCLQWGDTGKGKFVDLFADWADIIARGTGGDNAGHTICYGNKKYIFHIVPSGILYDFLGKKNVIGSGTVVNPRSLFFELETLKQDNLSYNNLMVALNSKLILPFHLVQDGLSEISAGKNKIGTTGRGIAWAYTDHYNRSGLIFNDLLNKDRFVEKIRANFALKKPYFSAHDPQLVKAILENDRLEGGIYWDEKEIFNLDAIIEKYLRYGEEFKPLIRDTDAFMRENVSKKKILLEGSQGLGLSIDYGTYPYVTSSDCSVYGLAKGVGLNYADIDLALGIIKGFYMTRVGEGPFPSELGGKLSDNWCNGTGISRHTEMDFFRKSNFQDNPDFVQGLKIRVEGDEYGATTGRPRRVGWLDLPFLRYALNFGVKDLISTKLDVLNDVDLIKVCNFYRYTGSPYVYGERTLLYGDILSETIMDINVLNNCSPIYAEFPGWKCSLENCQTYSDFPGELRDIVDYVSSKTISKIRILSTGADREKTIFI